MAYSKAMQSGHPLIPRPGAGWVPSRCEPIWATWLLLAALLLRGLIPLGYMPNPNAMGGFIPCVGNLGMDARAHAAHTVHTGHSDENALAQTGHGDHSGGERKGGEHEHNTPPCVFAAIAALAAVLTVLLALPVGRRLSTAWLGGVDTPRPRLPLPGTRLARGPPSLS